MTAQIPAGSTKLIPDRTPKRNGEISETENSDKQKSITDKLALPMRVATNTNGMKCVPLLFLNSLTL